MMSCFHVFQCLAGAWSVRRIISGARPIVGTAFFTKSSEKINRLSYREEVEFYLNGKVYNGYRSYVYRQENERIMVDFDDGRHFHTLRFSNSFPLVAFADHQCASDFYCAMYTFFHEDSFRLRYWVKGPKKDFTIDTSFAKIDSTGSPPQP